MSEGKTSPTTTVTSRIERGLHWDLLAVCSELEISPSEYIRSLIQRDIADRIANDGLEYGFAPHDPVVANLAWGAVEKNMLKHFPDLDGSTLNAMVDEIIFGNATRPLRPLAPGETEPEEVQA